MLSALGVTCPLTISDRELAVTGLLDQVAPTAYAGGLQSTAPLGTIARLRHQRRMRPLGSHISGSKAFKFSSTASFHRTDLTIAVLGTLGAIVCLVAIQRDAIQVDYELVAVIGNLYQ
jgi:hypothetical protein